MNASEKKTIKGSTNFQADSSKALFTKKLKYGGAAYKEEAFLLPNFPNNPWVRIPAPLRTFSLLLSL